MHTTIPDRATLSLCPLGKAREQHAKGQSFECRGQLYECDECPMPATHMVVVAVTAWGDMRWNFSCHDHIGVVSAGLHRRADVSPARDHQCGAFALDVAAAPGRADAVTAEKSHSLE